MSHWCTVRAGAICYLDEIVEARKDTMVVIHLLADNHRNLPIKLLEIYRRLTT